MKMSPLVIFLITLGKYIWASPRVLFLLRIVNSEIFARILCLRKTLKCI